MRYPRINHYNTFLSFGLVVDAILLLLLLYAFLFAFGFLQSDHQQVDDILSNATVAVASITDVTIAADVRFLVADAVDDENEESNDVKDGDIAASNDYKSAKKPAAQFADSTVTGLNGDSPPLLSTQFSSFQFVPNTIPEPSLAVIRKKLKVQKFDDSKTQNGFNVFAMMFSPFLVVTDMHGTVVAGHLLPPLSSLVGVKWVNSSTVVGLLVTYATTYAEAYSSTSPYMFNFKSGVEEIFNFGIPFLHHDVEYNQVTDTFMLLRNYLRGCPSSKNESSKIKSDHSVPVLFDELIEVDRYGNILWRWNAEIWAPYDSAFWNPEGKHPLTDCSGYGLRYCHDWSHINGFHWNMDDDCLYVNADHLATFLKIDKKTNQIVWSIGARGNMQLIDIHGKIRKALWSHSNGWQFLSSSSASGGKNAKEEVEEERFIFLDNDYHNAESHPSQCSGGRAVLNCYEVRSRLVEISVHPNKKEAREEWVWEPPLGKYSHRYGDVTRLPNGNTLASFPFVSSLTEISFSPSRSLWELKFHPKKKMAGPWNQFWVWHVERFFDAPLAKITSLKFTGDLAKIERTANDKTLVTNGVMIEIDTWESIRTRQRTQGVAVVELNFASEQKAVFKQIFQFSPNFQRTKVVVSLTQLSVDNNYFSLFCDGTKRNHMTNRSEKDRIVLVVEIYSLNSGTDAVQRIKLMDDDAVVKNLCN